MVRIILLVLLWMLFALLYLFVGAWIAYVIRTNNTIISLAVIYLWPIITPCILMVKLYRKVFG